MFLAVLSPIQPSLADPAFDAKHADVAPLLKSARQRIRQWNADAVIVQVQCEPNADGTVDLTVQGGNLNCVAYCPSKRSGAMISFDRTGAVSVLPSLRPLSPSTLAIPANIIGLSDAITTAMKAGLEGQLSRVELFGSGDDADLRQFCWMVMGETRPYCVDAVFGYSTSFQEFNNGRTRSKRLPITSDVGANAYAMRFEKEDVLMYWYREHALYLEGAEDAIKIQIPWQLVSTEEMNKHSHMQDGQRVYSGGAKEFPLGAFQPLNAEGRRRFLQDEDAIEINNVPGAVIVEGYSKMDKPLRARIKEWLDRPRR
ncbi:hypothetical protein BH09PLA1_BH09PLA1_28040 [soil metagenome]